MQKLAKKQASVSTTGRMAEILKEIYDSFPDLEPGNDGQAYQRALVDWSLNRDKNSKSAKLSSIKNDTERIDTTTILIRQDIANLKSLLIDRLLFLQGKNGG